MLVENHYMENMKKYKIIISGGGTGGHIFPAIAIAKELEKIHSNIDLLFVGAQDRMEMEKIPQQGYNIIGLWISGFQRRLSIKNLLFPIKLLFSLWKSLRIIKKFKPDLVIGTGGYASGPLLYIASRKKIPCLIQEQNSYPGITNKILSKYVQKVCVAYDNMDQFFSEKKIVLTGNPIRQSILNYTLIQDKNNSFLMDKSKPTILIIGGSLGALSINNAIKNNLEKLVNFGVNLVWQTGSSFYDLAVEKVEQNFFDCVRVHKFINDMHSAYSISDIIVSRAGAISISELCVVSKPVILVPSPNVAENHQHKNAQSLVNKKAALIVKDSEANCKLVEELIKLMKNKNLQKSLSKNIGDLAIKDSTTRISKIALELLK